MSDCVGPQGRGPHDLLGGVGCTIKILMGAGVVDGGSIKRCLSGLVGSMRSLWWVKTWIFWRRKGIMKVSILSLPP